MCGLVGVAGDVTKNEVKIFTDLLYISGLRGSKSSGVASCKNSQGRDVDWVKITAPPLDLIELNRFDEAVSSPRRFIMGHTRAPTVGEVSNANTQPFVFKSVVGAHNGTLHQFAQKKLVDWEKFGTDSEALIHSLHKRGAKDTLADLEGAWALTWFERDLHELRFLRNKERPLHYCYNKTRTVMFWASEAEMLNLALARNFVQPDEIFPVKVDTMYSWAIPTGVKQFKAPVQTSMPGYVWQNQPRSTFDSGRSTVPWNDDHFRSRIKGGVYQVWNPKTKTFEAKELTGSSGRLFEPKTAITATEYRKRHTLSDGAKIKFYKGFNGESLTREQYNEKTKSGCAWCSAQADWPENGSPDIVRFINNEDHFCWNCMTNQEALEHVGTINKDAMSK